MDVSFREEGNGTTERDVTTRRERCRLLKENAEGAYTTTARRASFVFVYRFQRECTLLTVSIDFRNHALLIFLNMDRGSLVINFTNIFIPKFKVKLNF